MLFSLFLCAIGLVFLTYAADKLVEGASNLAINIGVSKMVIGLTIVAAGTSLPELVVSINASLNGNPAISLGNVVGSNIVNASLILGLAAMISPIACEKQMVRRETPIMILVAGLLWYLARSGNILTPNEGFLLLALFVAYTLMSYFIGKNEHTIAEEIREKAEEVVSEKQPTTSQNVIYILVGLVGLVIGADLLIRGSVTIAQSLGISDEIIGLTLIAVGTSLPELATSIMAARKGQSGICLGNVVGSNIFNILGIVGCSAALPSFMTNATSANYLTVSPDMLGIHIPLMMVVSLGVLPIMRTGMRIVRLEGALLIAAYIAYTVMLYQSSGNQTPSATPVKQATTIETPAQGNNTSPAPTAAVTAEPASSSELVQDPSLVIPIVTASEATIIPTGIEASATVTP